jgi:hypothetical protein
MAIAFFYNISFKVLQRMGTRMTRIGQMTTDLSAQIR